MEWSELDGEVFCIPAERLRSGRVMMSLSRAMQCVLDQARALNGTGGLCLKVSNFQGHINKESPRVSMQRPGLDTSAHGLRLLARTYLREVLREDSIMLKRI